MICALALLSPALFADNWPAWRGPLGTGICAEKNFPTKWAVNQNTKWRVPMPERGNSSPVVWGNQVFITQAIEEQGLRQLICFDRRTGRQLWKSEVEYKVKEPTHRTNPFCSASPVTDGKRIFFLSEEGKTTVVAASPEYRVIATNQLDSGFMASPAVHNDSLILRTKTHLYRIAEP